ncbi:MAG TPA: T9SS type A sorting domain-containing protein, partial [Candidatus Paceibacterota bacterium]|nr:T9SS type A sorting domain-containing protein [Candidatus Paceibacterota bacterium]
SATTATITPGALLGALSTTINISSGRSFTVGGNFTVTDASLVGSTTTINNNGTMSVTGTTNVTVTNNAFTACYLKNDGTMNFNGATTLGSATGGPVYLQSITAGTPASSKVYFNGNVTLQATARSVAANTIANYYFDAPSNGAQTLTMNSSDVSFSNVTVGTGTNAPHLTFTGSNSITATGNVTINSAAVLTAAAATNNLSVAGNWTNANPSGNGYVANGNTVTLNGTTAGGTQVLSGITTFYNLTLNNANETSDFGTTTTTIAHNLTTAAGTMNGDASTVIFTGASGAMLGINAKNFYNLQINAGAHITYSVTGASGMHIANSYVNNGTFVQLNSLTTYFDQAGATETMSGSGTTTFGSLGIGSSAIGAAATTVNEGTHNFTVSGTDFKFYSTASTFDGGTGIVTFSGTANCVLSNALGVTGTSASFFGATVQNTLTLSATTNIKAGTYANPGTLTVNGTLNANGFLTLKSDANGTARVGVSAGTVSGNATVERYIPARKCWRLLSSGPFSDVVQSINAAWQDGFSNSTSNCISNGGTSGYATILFNGTTPPWPGYDYAPAASSNIKTFTSGGAAFVVPPSTTGVALGSNQGYFVFVYGDRQICTSGPVTATATTLRPKGMLTIGAITITLTGLTPGGYYLVKNPYASSVDVTNVIGRSTGIANMVEVWDAEAYGTYGYGEYVTASGTTLIPAGGTTNFPNAATVRIVQSGQAFIVQATATTATIKFTENDKTTVESSGVFALNVPSMNINLLPASTITPTSVQSYAAVSTAAENNAFGDPLGTQPSEMATAAQETTSTVLSATPIDGVAIRLSSDSNIVKLANTSNANYLSLQESGRNFLIQSKTLAPGVSDTFDIELSGIAAKAYTLSFDHQQFFNGKTATLIDKYMGVDTAVTDSTGYTFTVTSDSATYKHRFLVVVNGQTPFPRKGPRSFFGASIRIYPNPVGNTLNIIGLSSPEPAIITDVMGRALIRVPLVTSGRIDVSQLRRGVYTLTLIGREKISIKFIKW